MRIGEILIRLGIIDSKKLDDALTYAGYKTIPLGRAMRVLRYISEADLAKALEAQTAIRNGADINSCLAALRYAVSKDIPFTDAINLPHTALGLKEPINNATLIAVSARKDVGFAPIQKAPVIQAEAHTFEELAELGDSFFLSNQLDAAEKAYLKAFAMVDEVYGVPPSKVTAIITKMANLYFSADRFKEAQPLYERVLETHKRVFGPNSPESTHALEDLGDLYDIQDKFPEARRFFEQALNSMNEQKNLELEAAGRILKKLLAIAKRSGEPSQRSRLGELAVDAGLVTQAQMQESLEASRGTGKPLGSVLRDNHRLDTQQLESLMFAQMLVKQGTVPASVAVRAIKLSVSQAVPLRHLCEVGKWVAEREFNDETKMQLVLEQEKLLNAEATFGADSLEVAAIVQRLADMHLERKDKVTAEMLYKRALAVLQKRPDTDKLDLARSTEKLAQVHCQHGKYPEAQPLLLKALEYRQAAGKGESVEAAQCLWLIAKVELAQFNHATALSFLRSAKALYEKLTPSQVPAELLKELINCCMETGLTADIEPILVKLIETAKAENRQFEPETAHFMEQLGDVYMGSGKHAHAQAQYYAAMQIYERSPGSEAKAQLLSKKLSQSSKV